MQHQLQTYCQQHFPAYAGAHITAFQQISDGWENIVYAFTIGDDDLILRIYPGGQEAIAKSTREYQGMKALHRLGYPVPEVLHHSLDTAWFGQPFVIMQQIKGESFHSAYARASSEGREYLLARFCALLVDLHTLDSRPLHPPRMRESNPLWYVQTKLQQAKDIILGQFGMHYFAPVWDWLFAHMDRVPCSRWSILHGDFHQRNILLTPDGDPYVIDWCNVEVGDYRYDLAFTLLLARTQGKPQQHDLILNEYVQQRGSAVEQIEYYEVVAALRRLFVITLMLSGGAAQMAMRAEAVSVVGGQVDHIEAVYLVLMGYTGLRIREIEDIIARLR